MTHNFKTHYSKMHLNIILSFTPISSQEFTGQNYTFFLLVRTVDAHAHLRNNCGCLLQIVKLLFLRHSPLLFPDLIANNIGKLR
jgi:hypothetical protein